MEINRGGVTVKMMTKQRGLSHTILTVLLSALLIVTTLAPCRASADPVSPGEALSVHNAVVLVLDNSGSMSGAKAERLSEAAKQFSSELLEADPLTMISIVSFGSGTKTMQFTSNFNAIEQFVDHEMNDWGGTDVTRALKSADLAMTLIPDTGLVSYAKSIVVMSDGIPNSASSAREQAESMFDSYNMYSVGFMTSASAAEFLKSIQNSGYFDADDLDALIDKFGEIAEELLNPVVIAVSHEPILIVSPDQGPWYRINAIISNPNEKTVKNLKVTLSVPEGVTLQNGEASQITGDLGGDQSVRLTWSVAIDKSVTGSVVYSVAAGGDNTVILEQSDKIILDTQDGDDNRLEFGVDNWKFSNTPSNFGAGLFSGAEFYMTESDYNALISGLGNSVAQRIADARNGDWFGSCFGFSTTAILNKMGVTSPLDRQPGARTLHDLDSTEEAQSFINFYALSQFLPSISNDFIDFTALDDAEKVNQIIKKVKEVETGGSPVLLCFNLGAEDAGHAVVADEFDDGDYLVDSVFYNGRIRYYDPNHPDNEKMYLYVNSENGAWGFDDDDYKDTESTNGRADLTKACADLSLMNVKDIETSTRNRSAVLTALGATNRHNAEVRRGSLSWSLDSIKRGESGLVYWYSAGNESSSDINIALPNESDSYTVASADSYDYSLQYPDALVRASADSAGSVTFSRDGSVSLEGSSGAYSLRSTLDSTQGELYTFGVAGTDGGNVKIEKTDEGYVVRADSLLGATLTGEGSSISKRVTVDEDFDEVLLVSAGEDIQIAADNDDDGVFETIVASSSDNDDNPGGGSGTVDSPEEGGSSEEPNESTNEQAERPVNKTTKSGTPDTGDAPLFSLVILIVGLGIISCLASRIIRRLGGRADGLN